MPLHRTLKFGIWSKYILRVADTSHLITTTTSLKNQHVTLEYFRGGMEHGELNYTDFSQNQHVTQGSPVEGPQSWIKEGGS